jgi:hypothetical protein
MLTKANWGMDMTDQCHLAKHVKRKEKTPASCAQERNERRYPEAAAKYPIV